MIRKAYALAEMASDHNAMIKAGLALADVSGLSHSNKRSIDIQYAAAIQSMQHVSKASESGHSIELQDFSKQDGDE
jgi:hypothetical protein